MTTDRPLTLPIEGMSCDHCVERVTGALEGVDGVAEVNVDLDAAEATVRLRENVTRDRLVEAVDEVGYQVPNNGA